MESKGPFFILIIVVAVLTLTLAALAGYLFLVQGNSNGKTEVQASAAAVKNVPKEEDLINHALFEGKRYFNLKNDDPKKIAIIQVNVSLKCLKEIKVEKKVVNVEEKITFYSDEIQELIVRFFLNMTIDDIKNTAVMDTAKEELKKQINELLNEGQKEPQELVYKVSFSEWLFQ